MNVRRGPPCLPPAWLIESSEVFLLMYSRPLPMLASFSVLSEYQCWKREERTAILSEWNGVISS